MLQTCNAPLVDLRQNWRATISLIPTGDADQGTFMFFIHANENLNGLFGEESVAFPPQSFNGIAMFFNLKNMTFSFLAANDEMDKSTWNPGNLDTKGQAQVQLGEDASGLIKLTTIEIEYVNFNFTIDLIFINGNVRLRWSDSAIERLTTVTNAGFCPGGPYGFGFRQTTVCNSCTSVPMMRSILFHDITLPPEPTTTSTTPSISTTTATATANEVTNDEGYLYGILNFPLSFLLIANIFH